MIRGDWVERVSKSLAEQAEKRTAWSKKRKRVSQARR